MNNRMLELAIVAGLKKPHSSDQEYIGDFDWRAFGELIVDECVDCVLNSGDRYRREYFADRLKQHFGTQDD